MGWQRFNRTSNIFEVSDDNGSSWQPLVIAAGGLPSNIAYTNAINNFSVDQQINKTAPLIYFRDPSGATDKKLWRIETNASVNIMRIAAVNDANSAYLGVFDFDRAGNLSVGNNLAVAGIFNVTGISNLADAIVVRDATQGALYFGSGKTAYLWRSSDQVLHIAGFAVTNIEGGPVEVNGYIRSTVGLYDYNRGIPIGAWTNWTPTYTGMTVTTTYTMKYMIIGKTVFLNIYIAANCTVTGNTVSLSLPAGLIAQDYDGAACSATEAGAVVPGAFLYVQPSANVLNIFKSANGAGNWTTGNALVITGQTKYRIA